MIQDPVTGQLEWINPQLWRVRKTIISFLAVGVSVCVVFSSVAGVVLYKVVMRVKLNCTAEELNGATQDGKFFCLLMVTIVPTVLNSLSIMILGYLYTKLVYKLTDWGQLAYRQLDHSL